MLHAKGLANQQKEKEQQQQQQQAQAMLAAMASRTILKKLGSAFWDAFTGVSASSSLSASSSSGPGVGLGSGWDTDKVKRVLEGKAVLRVVDVDGPFPSTSSAAAASVPASTVVADKSVPTAVVGNTASGATGTSKCSLGVGVCDLLEESMRSLTLGKKM